MPCSLVGTCCLQSGIEVSPVERCVGCVRKVEDKVIESQLLIILYSVAQSLKLHVLATHFATLLTSALQKEAKIPCETLPLNLLSCVLKDKNPICHGYVSVRSHIYPFIFVFILPPLLPPAL